MSNFSAINSATQGIQRGLQDASKRATKIAHAGTSESTNNDITEASVELLQSIQQIEASAKAVQRIDEAIGSIIDTRT